MWHLFDRYKGVVWPSAKHMNLISRILNNICKGTGIELKLPSDPSPADPVTISVDTDWLDRQIQDALPEEPDLSALDGLEQKTLAITSGGSTLQEATYLASSNITLAIKRITAGEGISVSESNGLITVTNTRPGASGGGSGGGGTEISGYSGDLVVCVEPRYDTTTHQLLYTPVTLTFSGGVLQSMSPGTETVITTAVEETA